MENTIQRQEIMDTKKKLCIHSPAALRKLSKKKKPKSIITKLEHQKTTDLQNPISQNALNCKQTQIP